MHRVPSPDVEQGRSNHSAGKRTGSRRISTRVVLCAFVLVVTAFFYVRMAVQRDERLPPHVPGVLAAQPADKCSDSNDVDCKDKPLDEHNPSPTGPSVAGPNVAYGVSKLQREMQTRLTRRAAHVLDASPVQQALQPQMLVLPGGMLHDTSARCRASGICDLPADASCVRGHDGFGCASTLERREAVMNAIAWAWQGYADCAWGHDEVHPLTCNGSDWMGLALTMIDGLDTLILAGLEKVCLLMT